ncbi:cyclic di-GMP phosphodiesterase [Salinisphaera aquimarina]
MFVEALDKPWLETDYLLEGVQVETEDDIERLRRTAKYVFVTAGGDIGPEESDAGGQHPVSESKALASDREPRSFKDELRQARIIHGETKVVVDEVHDNIRAGKKVDTDGAREVVAQMMASVARHPDALVWFTNLKNRDQYTAEHSMNVCTLAIALATYVGESEQSVHEMGVGALLHDVGKIKVPISILNKPGKLTDQELAEMRRHPEYGYEILKNGSNLSPESLEIVIAHHERMDGGGYPRKLVGDQISYYSQLVAIADVYDAITSDRVYQDGRSPADAMKIMRDATGHLNPELLGRFIESLGAYPIGSLVELNTGEVGFVVPTAERQERPTVLIVLDHRKRRYFPQRVRDLNRFPKFKIIKLLAGGAYGVSVDDYAEGWE